MAKMKKAKKALTLDPALTEEYLALLMDFEREKANTAKDIADLKAEFKDKGLNCRAVDAVLRAEKALAKTETPDVDLDNLAILVRKKLDITDI